MQTPLNMAKHIECLRVWVLDGARCVSNGQPSRPPQHAYLLLFRRVRMMLVILNLRHKTVRPGALFAVGEQVCDRYPLCQQDFGILRQAGLLLFLERNIARKLVDREGPIV